MYVLTSPQATTDPDLMAQMISSRDSHPPMAPSSFGLPDFESPPHPDWNFSASLPPPATAPGFPCPTYHQAAAAAAEGLSKSRKRGAEEDLGPRPWSVNAGIVSAGMKSSSANGSYPNHTNPLPRGGGNCEFDPGMLKEQRDLDLLMFFNMEKLRMEMLQKGRFYWRSILQVVEERLQRTVKEKDEEMETARRKNTALEEKVKVLAMEGEVWKGISEKSEVTAMSLRRELEQAQLAGEEGEGESAMSCCDSPGEERRRWRCHGCRRNEVGVLLLPCRHLCLCSDCDPKFQSCPRCLSSKTASIRVHMN